MQLVVLQSTPVAECGREFLLSRTPALLEKKAFRGKRWPRVHEKRLSKLVSDLFSAATERGGSVLCGILLNEVGNLSELVDELGREKLDRVLTACF